jgi:hypothetical protein
MVETWHYPLLFLAALAAGFVDSIAGGGGLITIPALLSCGLNPQHALGTNKLQACFGSGSATWHYAQGGAVKLRECRRGFVITLVGAALGAFVVQNVDPDLLRKAIPVLLILVAIYTVCKPDLGAVERHARMPEVTFDLVFGLAIGFYDGFFGPGTGTFWAMAYMLGLGYTMTRATGHTKVMNFASNISSLVLFLAGGKVLFIAGFVMGAGQLLGARLGARMVIARGTRFIRPFFLSVVGLLVAKLLYDAYTRR